MIMRQNKGRERIKNKKNNVEEKSFRQESNQESCEESCCQESYEEGCEERKEVIPKSWADEILRPRLNKHETRNKRIY